MIAILKILNRLLCLVACWYILVNPQGVQCAEQASVNQTSISGLNNLFLKAQQASDYKEAAEIAQAALALMKRTGQDPSIVYGTWLHRLGVSLYQQERFREATAYYKQASDNLPHSDPKARLLLISTLLNLSDTYITLGQYSEAKEVLLRVQHIQQQGQITEPKEVVKPLIRLAKVYKLQEAYTQAELLLQSILKMLHALEKTPSEQGLEALSTLGTLYRVSGQYQKADVALQQLLKLRALKTPHNPTAYAAALNNLAFLRMDQGLYSSSETLFKESLQILEASTANHSLRQYSFTLDNLGKLYRLQGRYKYAEASHIKARTLIQNTFGTRHRDYAVCLNNLALLYIPQGRLDEAKPLLEEALEINASIFGEDSVAYAISLDHLAQLHHKRRELNVAAQNLLQAISIYENKYTNGHPKYAQAMDLMGQILFGQGKHRAAEKYFLTALKAKRASQGATHPSYAETLAHLSDCYLLRRNFREAWQLREQAFNVNYTHLQTELATASERGVQDYLENIEGGKSVAATSAALMSPEKYHGIAFNAVLQTKALDVDIISNFRQLLQKHRYHMRFEDAITQLETLKEERNLLQGMPDRSKQLEATDNAIAELERTLREQFQNGDVTLATPVRPTYQDLQPILQGQHAAYIDFVRIKVMATQKGSPDVSPTSNTQPTEVYAAYVVTANGEPRLFKLGPAQEIDKIITDFKEGFTQPGRSVLANAQTSRAESEAAYKKKAKEVYRHLLKPLEQALASHRRLYISPDSLVSDVPFEALTNEADEYAASSRDIIYLTSGRDLLNIVPKRASAPQNSIKIFSGPDYNLPLSCYLRLLGSPSLTFPSTKDRLSPNQEKTLACLDIPQTTNGSKFGPLPGAMQEGVSILKVLTSTYKTFERKPILFQQERALEDWVKTYTAPHILHFATHGFFISAPKGPVSYLDHNPLRRSGLALSGANTLPKSSNTANDGILYADEIALLQLKGTSLVVLSACQTAMGVVRTGQGVFGLSRAFLYAGTNTVISSLNNVDDRATELLMKTFYQHYIGGKMTKLQAFNAAKATVRNHPLYAHPFYWASFILVGDPD